MIADDTSNWRSDAQIAIIALLITLIGGSLVCMSWIRDLGQASVIFLGSGSDLSVLIVDGPARILLASGNDPIAFENAFLANQPLFARRVDLLLISGNGPSLRVPEAARHTTIPRQIAALGPIPRSPELEPLQPLDVMSGHQHIRLSRDTSIWIETRLPIGADARTTVEAWRLTVEHRSTRIVIYSDGPSVPVFPPPRPASVVAIAGANPLAFSAGGNGSVFVSNATQIGGPDLREALSSPDADSSWFVRVHPGDAVRLLFTADGVDVPAWAAIDVQVNS